MNLEPSRFFSSRKHLRVSNPPGGASNIFNGPDQSAQPRKIRDNQKSSIFGGDQPDSVKTPVDQSEEDERNFLSPRHQENTKQRLFGDSECGASPRRVNDTWRSNVFSTSASADCLSDEAPKRTPKRSPSVGINPITGELLLASPLEENGVSHTNGLKNGTESEEDDSMVTAKQNGHHNGNGEIAEKKTQNGRQPPGGKSSGIF